MDITLDIEPMPKPQNMRAHDGRRMHYKEKLSKRGRQRIEYIERYFTYCQQVGLLAKDAGFSCPETLSLTFVISMPVSWSKKKRREKDGTPHQGKRQKDLSNLIKAFEDATYTGDTDDGEIWQYGQMQKRWGEKGRIIIHDTDNQ